MDKPKILSRVIVPHSEDCFAKGGKHEWSGITQGAFHGNYAANENAKRRSHYWHNVLCNDPNCPGIKAVHSYVLIKA